MQIQQFTSGGYVAHKMTVHGSPCRFSAWFTAEGLLNDCERIDAKGRAYPVGNMGDSDSPARPDWVNPSTVSGVCANLDRMFRDLEDGGILTDDERQAIYDTL